MKSALLVVALALAGCGHMPPPGMVPCTQPHPVQSPCIPEDCKEGEPGCVCDGPKCQKITTCPVPVPADARVSR